ncbi:MAG TPA: hypothetical protein VD861_10330, partial [Pyrinomonadaceae bacterium]|nr:hypothetical protein [Pyrinomonadaceae bacterium]
HRLKSAVDTRGSYSIEVDWGDLIFIRLLLAPESERVMEGVVWGRVAHHVPEVGFGVEFKKLPPGHEDHIRDIVEFHLEAGDEA